MFSYCSFHSFNIKKENGLWFCILFCFLLLYFVQWFIFLWLAFAIMGLSRAIGGSTCGILLSSVKIPLSLSSCCSFPASCWRWPKPRHSWYLPVCSMAKCDSFVQPPPCPGLKLRYPLESEAADKWTHPEVAVVASVSWVQQMASTSSVL